MVESVVIAVFDTENQAFHAVADLKQLGADQSVQIRQGGIVTKDAQGEVALVDTKREGGPWGVVGGPIIGGLLGVLGGPAGMAAGALAGGVVGVMTDLLRHGVKADFVSAASAELKPGQSAIVMVVDEAAPDPVNAIVGRYGGRVMRNHLYA